MTNYTGTAGDDNLTGSAANDRFDLSQGGMDTAAGGGGDDVFVLKNTYFYNTQLDGGDGNDTLILEGNYVSTLDSNVRGVERLLLLNGYDYNFTRDISTSSDTAFLVDASHLGPKHSLTFKDTYPTEAGSITVWGGAGDDRVTLGGPNNVIDGGAGNDDLTGLVGHSVISGGDGNDKITSDVSGDVIDGGAGSNFAVIDRSTYSSDLVFDGRNPDHIHINDGTTISNFEAFDVRAGSGNNTIFGGAGNDTLDGGTGTDTLRGGAGDDTLYAKGDDSLFGGEGNDDFYFTNGYGYPCLLDGGSGVNTLHWNAYFDVHSMISASLVAGAHDSAVLTVDGVVTTRMSHIQKFVIGGDFLFVNNLKIVAGNGDDHISCPNSPHTSINGGGGNDIIDEGLNGAGWDVINGGSGDDIITGGALPDILNGGSGHDTFVYQSAEDTAGSYHDTIVGFDAAMDYFEMPVGVSGIDPKIIVPSIDDTLMAFEQAFSEAVNANVLAAHHAVLLKENGDESAHRTYLIVDANGIAGYQAATDYTIQLDHGHLAGLSSANFTLGA